MALYLNIRNPDFSYTCARYLSTFKKKILKETKIFNVRSSDSSKKKSAYVFGNSGTGALGIEHLVNNSSIYHPTILNEFINLKLEPIKVACGYGFTVYICKNAQRRLQLYGCGVNSEGQLGQHFHSLKGTLDSGDPVNVISIPTKIDLNIKNNDELVDFYPSHVACGRAHTLVAFSSKSQSNEDTSRIVFSFGNNVFGQCCREIIPDEYFCENTAVVTKILLPPEIKGIKQLVCGQDHSLILNTDGHVYSCGLGSDGQLGLGHCESVGQLSLIQGLLEGQHVSKVVSRGDTVLALTNTNRLFAWGNNEYGQIWPEINKMQVLTPVELDLDKCYVPPESQLDPKSVSIGNIVSIACAGSMCLILNELGQVFVWGFGCIGLGPLTDFAQRPTLIPPALFATSELGSASRLISITSGLHHFIAQSNEGDLWAWGAPRGGIYCLGLGTQISKRDKKQTYPLALLLPDKAFSVSCGVDHTVVLT